LQVRRREVQLPLTDTATPPPEADRLLAVLRDRLRQTSQEPISLPAAQDPRLSCACAITLEHLATPLTLSALADAARTTERTLSRLFRRETGMSYPQWRAQASAIHAMILLAQGESVTDTANLCGWSTTSAFIDSFRRAMGQTPGAYRDLAAR
jgi:AraC-like DNA-binding protein